MVRLSSLALLCLTALTAALLACGPGDSVPAVQQVRPESVPPGGMVIVSGRNLDGVRSVTIGGRAAASVSPVNDTLLTLVAPADVPPGDHELRLTTSAGRRAVASIQVDPAPARPGAVAGVGSPAPAVLASPTPSPTARPVPTATPARTAAPVAGVTATPSLSPAPARATPSVPPATPPPRRGDDNGRNEDDDDGDDREDGRRGNGRGRGRP